MPDQKELLWLKNVIVAKFTEENWLELGLVTDAIASVKGHSRLLRSLNWNDPDYAGHALNVLMNIVAQSPNNFDKIRDYVDAHFSEDEVFVSSKANVKRITFSPSVFEIPDGVTDKNLVSVMMPFATEFQAVYTAIKSACESAGFTCKRAPVDSREKDTKGKL